MHILVLRANTPIPIVNTMPTKTRLFTTKFFPRVIDPTGSGYVGAPLNLQDYNNVSNWVYYPGTKRPNLSVQNAHIFENQYVRPGSAFRTVMSIAGSPSFATLNGAMNSGWSLYGGYVPTSKRNEALARFNGKLRKGSASLGVTLGSWAESRKMIVSRLNHTSGLVDRAYHSLKGSRSKRKDLGRDPLANNVLEVEFGWRPLFSDIQSALTTVCEDGVPPQWVRASAKFVVANTRRADVSGGYHLLTDNGTGFVTVAASVSINNPNVWLLNRLGLLNPATVAWDLVPWSFVVNMFVNVNQMISSVTDEIGLTISDRSTTESLKFVNQQSYISTNDVTMPSGSPPSVKPLRGLTAAATTEVTLKRRSVGAFPKPQWQVKTPKVDWELAVIASSLLLQKANRLNKLIKGI